MASQHPPSVSLLLDKWVQPLTALGIIVGGVVWLTTLHSIAEQNQMNIEKIQMEMDADKTRIYSRLNELDQKMADLSTLLGRMEGKLDMIVQRRGQ